MMRKWLALCVIAFGCWRQTEARNIEVTKPTSDVLCLGDSIRMGYAKYLPCETPQVNCKSTRDTLAHLDEWTKGRHWRAITFNCGLHDIHQLVPREEYRANLREIVQRLRPQCDRLYFCMTTPGRQPIEDAPSPVASTADVEAYNRVSREVMLAERVPVIDLYSLAMTHREWWRGSLDVHYTDEGYKGMADVIKKAIGQ